MSSVRLSLAEVHELSVRVLRQNGMAVAHADAIAKVITAGERDECRSHGVYRLIVCVRTLRQGRVSAHAIPTIQERSPAIVAVDAHGAYSQLAFQTGLEVLTRKARENGIAAMAINNCYHFSALWPEVEAIAEQGLAGIALTPSHAWVAPEGGSRGVFGTNPMAFAWPRPDRSPYVFDFATSAVARGEIELHARTGQSIPLGWGVDAQGRPTTDPAEVLQGGAMKTFGGHKGSALSTMIELLAGPLIGDFTSLDSLALDDGAGATPCHGELVLAFDPQIFGLGDAQGDQARAERLFSAINSQGARLPSERRYLARARSERDGVQVSEALYQDILALAP